MTFIRKDPVLSHKEHSQIQRIEELQKERNFICAVLDAVDALLIVLDQQGRVVQFNRACEEISGYAFGEVKGRHIWNLFLVTEEVMPIKAIFENIRDGRFPNRHENCWITKDGARCQVAWSSTALTDDRGKVEYGIWIGFDITDRKETEEALRDSEERYRALIENVRDGVALIQNETLRFTNDAFALIMGYKDASEVIGRTVTAIARKHFESGFTEFLNTALDNKSWGLPFRGKCIAKNGREFWAEKLSSVISYKGRPAILLTVRDITEHMLWEQIIKQEAEYFRSENLKLKSSIGERYRLGNIIGKSPAMQKIYELILKAASTDANVIILGKSGTGKELVARAIYEISERSDKPFVAVNCGAIPENLIESEFFGYRKGAFTGANADRHGYLRTAHTGTLFLDEIGDIGLNMQVKLLRALETGEYTPVGDTRPQRADARIITATNKDPSEMVKKGLMREDFFYRVSVIPISLPDLKQREEDIPLLVEHFLRLYEGETDGRSLPPDIMGALCSYDWPGNIRELQNVLQRFLTVRSLDFMGISRNSCSDDETPAPHIMPTREELKGANLQNMLDAFEKKVIMGALETVRWNRTEAALTLGISRRSLFRRMKKLGV